MKILFVSRGFHNTRNAGMRDILASELYARDYDVHGIQYTNVDTIHSFPIQTVELELLSTPTWIRKWQQYRKLPKKLKNIIHRIDPDIVIPDRWAISPTLQATNRPTIAIVQGLGLTRYNPSQLDLDKSPDFFSDPLSVKLQYPFVTSLHTQNKNALKNSDEVLVITDFLKKSLMSTFEVDSKIFHMPVRIKEFVIDTTGGEFITGINLRNRMKGPNIFINLAKNMEDKRFLIVGDLPDWAKSKVKNIDNIKYVGWIDNITEVLRNTKLLIVPSIYQEGAGRVIVEAFCAGTPAIGSNRGGIPETIGSGGEVVNNIFEISEWKICVEKILNNYQYYLRMGKEETKKYEVNLRVNEFENIIKDIVY